MAPRSKIFIVTIAGKLSIASWNYFFLISLELKSWKEEKKYTNLTIAIRLSQTNFWNYFASVIFQLIVSSYYTKILQFCWNIHWNLMKRIHFIDLTKRIYINKSNIFKRLIWNIVKSQIIKFISRSLKIS